MIETVAVIGAGTMGNGIAHVFAAAGFPVNLVDLDESRLRTARETIGRNLERQVAKGILTEDERTASINNISTMTRLPAGVERAGLVIEAATENSAIKTQLFRQLDEAAPPQAILASNTSSISITLLAASTRRPHQVIGMHFMNPVPVMKLVEVINGFSTAPEVTQEIVALARTIGKVPCIVKDYPGFIANRILMPMINEAIFCLHEQVAGVESIDRIMTTGMSHPMGPLQLADFIGLDVCLSIMQVLHEGFGNPKYAPCPLLRNMVAAGDLGVKTGRGFYRYTPGNKDLTVSERFQ
jgi:3-hydroxybutyryl-CoA dehydrogenase